MNRREPRNYRPGSRSRGEASVTWILLGLVGICLLSCFSFFVASTANSEKKRLRHDQLRELERNYSEEKTALQELLSKLRTVNSEERSVVDQEAERIREALIAERAKFRTVRNRATRAEREVAGAERELETLEDMEEDLRDEIARLEEAAAEEEVPVVGGRDLPVPGGAGDEPGEAGTPTGNDTAAAIIEEFRNNIAHALEDRDLLVSVDHSGPLVKADGLCIRDLDQELAGASAEERKEGANRARRASMDVQQHEVWARLRLKKLKEPRFESETFKQLKEMQARLGGD